MADVVSSTDKIIFYMCDFVFYYIINCFYLETFSYLSFRSFIHSLPILQSLKAEHMS